ncbi:MAG: hypothetical protein ACFFD1_15060, partial [Candidatus Thorarchaeota archaeon]
MINIKRSKSELWKLSAICYGENFFRSRLLRTATSERINVLERYEKNYTSQNRYNIFTKLAISGLLVVISVLPIMNIFQLFSVHITADNINSLIFSSSAIFSLFFLVTFSCLMTFNLTDCAILFKGEIFDFLRQFSLSENDLKSISLFVFLRMNRIQFIFMIFPLPLFFLFLTSSFGIFLVLLFYCTLNTVFV